jgi:tetratricopeptide (TPR) repeat protein
MGISPQLRFSDSNSFRLFTEGVEQLQSYELNARAESLEKAAGKLAECVANYPDVLPRLYLGIVRAEQGEELDEAMRLLREVLDRNVPELRSTAKYYLAEAYLLKYTAKDIAYADTLLEQVESEEAKNPKDRARVEELKLRSQGQRVFIYIREELWKKRTLEVDLSEEHRKAVQRLESFKTAVERAALSRDLRSAVESDYWNAFGLLKEYEAHRARTEQAKNELVHESLDAFGKAAEYGSTRADAKSNQARVYIELLNDEENAIRLCEEVLAIRKDDSFAHLLLGQVYERTRPQEAIRHYQKAAKFGPRGSLGAGRCYEKLGAFERAIREYSKVPESYHGFGEASFRIGAINERLGKIDEALEFYRKVPSESKEFFSSAQQAIKTLETRN